MLFILKSWQKNYSDYIRGMSIFKSKLKTYEKSRKWSEGITWRSAHACVSVCRGSFSCDPDSKGEVQNHHGLFPFQCHVQVVMFRLLQCPPVVGREEPRNVDICNPSRCTMYRHSLDFNA